MTMGMTNKKWPTFCYFIDRVQRHLTGSEVLLWLMLLGQCNERRLCRVDVSDLAVRCRRTKWTIRKCIRELEALGLIVRLGDDTYQIAPHGWRKVVSGRAPIRKQSSGAGATT